MKTERTPKWTTEVASRLAACAGAKNRREFLRHFRKLDDNDIMCVVEAAANILDGKAKISNSTVRTLRPHAQDLRRLASIRILPRARREISQTGGAVLPILVPIIVSVLSSLVQNALQ